jgi:hypothetical protein
VSGVSKQNISHQPSMAVRSQQLLNIRDTELDKQAICEQSDRTCADTDLKP